MYELAKNENHMDNSEHPYVRVKVRRGDAEIEVEGPADYVDRRVNAFLNGNQYASNVDNSNYQSSEYGEGDGNDDIETVVGEFVEEPEPLQPAPKDLLAFYRHKSPKNQSDTVLVITYFYQVVKDYKQLELEDYEEGFAVLRKAAVKMPSNMKSSVRNVVDRTDYLFNPERGKFSLTIQGEEYVQAMPQINDENE